MKEQQFGNAGHYICADWCRFHMCTLIGKYLVSTVGEYFPDEGVREITATSRGIVLEGRGDARRNDYMKKIGFDTIGYDRKYETMVFKAGKPCASKDCGCGLPEVASSALDFFGYNERKAATLGHRKMVARWKRKQMK